MGYPMEYPIIYLSCIKVSCITENRNMVRDLKVTHRRFFKQNFDLITSTYLKLIEKLFKFNLFLVLSKGSFSKRVIPFFNRISPKTLEKLQANP